MPYHFKALVRRVPFSGLAAAWLLAVSMMGHPAVAEQQGAPGEVPVRLKVLVGDIDGVDGPMTRHLVETLKDKFPAGAGIAGIDVEPVVLAGDLPKDKAVEKFVALHIHARSLSLLKRRSADLLIRGVPLPGGKGYRLQFMPGQRLSANLSRFPGTRLDLPATPDKGHAATLIGAVVLAGSAAAPDQARYLAEHLPPLAEEMRSAFEGASNAWQGSVSAHAVYANMVLVLGQLRRDKAVLEEAASAFTTVAGQWTRASRPWDWARTQLSLGETFSKLHSLDPKSPRIVNAAAAYRAALTVYSREKTPQHWAAAQGFLAGALILLADFEDKASHLHEAVAALRGAMEIVTRERAPAQWSWYQGSLGTALLGIGLREKDNSRIEEAVDTLRSALEVVPREEAVSQWASLQGELGLALASLDGREEEAVHALRASLSGYDPKKQPSLWGGLQVRNGLLLSDMAQREQSAGRYREAIAAYRAGLTAIRREDEPDLWAAANGSLGVALHFLGLMENDKSLIEQAADSYRAALEIHTREKAPAEWAGNWNNLGEAYGNIGEMEQDPAKIEKGIALIREALEVWTRKDMPSKWAYGSEQLATFLIKLAEQGGSRKGLKEAVSVLNYVIAWHEGTDDTGKAAKLRELLIKAKSL